MGDQKWDMSRLDNGSLSALRRAAGTTGTDIAALRAFYKACGYCDPRLEKYWYPAACMDALWRSTDVAEVKPMEECLRELMAGGDTDATASLQHRIDMLLETSGFDDGFLLGKLYALVRLVKNKTTLKPDFQKLADDLRRWNHPEHRVQRRWLRTLYNINAQEKNEEAEGNAD